MQRRALWLPPDRQAAASAQTCPAPGINLNYPVTRTVDQQDNYHGTVIADPYRWLEDANSEDTKTG
jgi:prolyl oligopeptidase